MLDYDSSVDGFPAPLDRFALPDGSSPDDTVQFGPPADTDIVDDLVDFTPPDVDFSAPVMDTQTALARTDLRVEPVPPAQPDLVKNSIFDRITGSLAAAKNQFMESASRVTSKLVENPDDFGLNPNQQVGTPPDWAQEKAVEDAKSGALVQAPAKAWMAELEKIGFDDEKSSYLWRTALEGSVTGAVAKNSFTVEIDPEMEASLDYKDKILRMAMTFGPDIWLFGLGGMVPSVVRGAAAKASFTTLPWFARAAEAIATTEASTAITTATSFGFHSGVREWYMNHLADGGDKKSWVELVGSITYAAVKDGAVGMVMGKGNMFREALYKSSISPIVGIGRATTEAAIEFPAVAVLMHQMEKPGVLPDKEDMIIATGAMLGLHGVGAGLKMANILVNGSDPVFMKMRNTYTKHAVDPFTVAEEMNTRMDVIESALNPEHASLKPYDIKAGVPQEVNKGVMIFDEANKVISGEKPLGPTSPLVEGVNPTTLSVTSVPFFTHTANKPGVEYPIPLQPGDAYEIIQTTTGVPIALPNNYERSLSMSSGGLLDNPILMAFAESIGISVRSGSKEFDPVFEPDSGGVVLGYFSRPEIAKAKRVKSITQAITRAESRLRRYANQDLSPEHSDFENRFLDSLRTQLAEEQSALLKSEDAKIVINRILGATPEGMQLQTLSHEIGHFMSYISSGWERGNTSGLSHDFYDTLSSYSGVVSDIITYAQNKGLNYDDILAEGFILSKAWRPAKITEMLQSQYRSSGAELIADVVSISLNKPDFIERYAPNLARAMELFYSDPAHPGVGDSVKQLHDMVAAGKDKEAFREMLTSSFNKAESLAADRQKNLTADAATKLDISGGGLMQFLVDKYAPVYNVVKNANRVEDAIQRYQSHVTVKTLYTSTMKNYFLDPMDKLGILEDEVSMLGIFRRIMADPGRAELHNTYGLTPITADKYYRDLIEVIEARTGIADIGPQINSIFSNFHEARKLTVIKWAEESGRYGDDFLDLIKNNETWFHFDDLGHYEESINAGIYPGKKKATKTKTGREYESQKQIGSLGPIRPITSATFEYDMAMTDTILHDNAVEALILHSLSTGDFPTIPKSEFDLIAKGIAPNTVLAGYSPRDFKAIGLPTRVLVKDTGRYVTIRKEWMMPSTLVDLFSNNSTPLQLFMVHVANNSFLDLAKQAHTKKTLGAAAAVAVKGLNISAATGRYFQIVSNPAFQAANALFYDPSKSFINLPNTGEMPWEGKGTLPIHYLKAFVESVKIGLTGELSPRMIELMEDGVMNATTRYTEAADLSNSTLQNRLMDMYGLEGYRNKVQWKSRNILNEVIKFIEKSSQAVAMTSARTSKLAAKRYFEEKRAQGHFSYISQAEENVLIRTAIGDPSTQIKGTGSSLINMFAMYYTSICVSTRGNWRRAKKAGVAEAVGNRLPVWMLSTAAALMAAGYFDEDDDDRKERQRKQAIDSYLDNYRHKKFGEKDEGSVPFPVTEMNAPTFSEILATQTENTLNNNFVIPLSIDPITGNGRVISLPFSQDPEIRLMWVFNQFFVKSLHKAVTEDPNDTKSRRLLDEVSGLMASGMQSVTQAGGYMSPSLNPAFSAVKKMGDLMFTGNTKEEFTGRDKHPTDLYLAEDRIASGIDSVLKEYGVGKAMRNPKKAVESLDDLFDPDASSDMTTSNRVIGALSNVPGPAGIFNRFVKDTNAGIKEKAENEMKEASSRVSAATSILVERAKNGEQITTKEKEKVLKIVRNDPAILGRVSDNFVEKLGLEKMREQNPYLHLGQVYGNTKVYRKYLESSAANSENARHALEYLNARKSED